VCELTRFRHVGGFFPERCQQNKTIKHMSEAANPIVFFLRQGTWETRPQQHQRRPLELVAAVVKRQSGNKGLGRELRRGCYNTGEPFARKFSTSQRANRWTAVAIRRAGTSRRSLFRPPGLHNTQPNSTETVRDSGGGGGASICNSVCPGIVLTKSNHVPLTETTATMAGR
jgi:hypothetical protein